MTQNPPGEPDVPNLPVSLLVLDVDGVLTDGTIRIDDNGVQSRVFHIHDGLGIRLWKAVGRKVAILTSKDSPAVVARAEMLKIDVIEKGVDDKLPGFERILAATGAKPEQTAYVGDDLLDAVVMRKVGFPIAVANAVDEIKEISRYVTELPGGQGAVREAIEHILRRDERWTAALATIGADQ